MARTLTYPSIPDGFLRRWCDCYAASSESPPGAFLVTGLAVLSGIMAPRMAIQWSPHHAEAVNLFLLNVGVSARSRKTSGLTAVKQAARWANDEADDEVVRCRSIARVSDAGLMKTLDVVGPETEREQRRVEKETPKGKPVPEVDPVIRPVPLSQVLTINEIVNLWRAEPSDYVAATQSSLLSVYDGEVGSNTRATAVSAQAACVTAIGNIPPRVLLEETSPRMISSGFVGRWLVIPTPPPVRLIATPNGHGKDTDRIQRDVAALQRLALTAGADPVSVVSLMTRAALSTRDQWYAALWKRVGDLGDDEQADAAGELAGRLQATALKLAALAAVARTVDPDALHHKLADHVRIERADIEWGQEVVDSSAGYLLAAMIEHAETPTSTVGKFEQRVLDKMLEARALTPERGIAKGELLRSCRSSMDYGAASRALDGMVVAGLVAFVQVPPGPKGGRPSERFHAVPGGTG